VNDKFNKKRSIPSIIGNVFASLGIIFGIFILFTITSFIVDFDGNWNTIIMNVCFIILPLTLIMLLWNKKHIKILTTIIVLSIVILIANAIYYENYSMKIEPLIYLHNKYNFNISDMKITESTTSSRGDILGQGGTNRSSTIKYKEYTIYVYYNNGWQDDYNERIRFNEKDEQNLNKFNSIIKTYTNDFKIIKDPQLDEQVDDDNGYTDYGYIIYLYISDENDVDNIINQLDNYVANNNSCYINYGLYIVKNQELYSKLINSDISILNSNNTGVYGQTYASDLLKTMGYNAQRITSTDGYDKNIFINNGDKTDSEYQNPENFEYIVFWYSAERNSFVGYNKPNMQVFGIKR
jgi:hypothetical protein